MPKQNSEQENVRPSSIEDFDRQWSFGEGVEIFTRQLIGCVAGSGAGAIAGQRYFGADATGGDFLRFLPGYVFIPLALVAFYMAYDLAKAMHEDGLGRRPLSYLLTCLAQIAATSIVVALAGTLVLGRLPDFVSPHQTIMDWAVSGVVASVLLQTLFAAGWAALGRLIDREEAQNGSL